MKLGITGHRKFGDPADLIWSEERIREKVRDYAEILGFTSLAKGADQIFARVVLELEGQLEAVLPFAEYADSLEGAAESAGFKELIGRCSEITTLEFTGSREQSYLAAGRYVAD